MKIFWDEVFVVRNSVFSIQYSAVIFRKRSDFEMQFCLIVLSFTFKRVSKDNGDGSIRSQEKGTGCDNTLSAFVGVFFFNFWSTLPNEQKILKPLDKCF